MHKSIRHTIAIIIAQAVFIAALIVFAHQVRDDSKVSMNPAKPAQATTPVAQKSASSKTSRHFRVLSLSSVH